ncbi:hypothetical protein HPB47_002050, partial [Ixodes persulcatus]
CGHITNYGNVATLIKKTHKQTKLNSEAACSDYREVVSTRVNIGETRINIHNIYIRPSVGSNEANWIKNLVQKDKHTILAGDFNARHTAWGYANKNARGKNIKKACVAAGLQLCNDPDTPTRLAQAKNQNDTSPDLTWVSPRLRVQWQVQADPMGSDHLPIHIRLLIRTTPRRRVTFTKWDDFRTAISRLSGVPFADRIRQALSESRTEYNVREGTPSPDLHLVKLWDKRLEALLCYRTRKSLRNKIRLNHATAEAKRYTIKLCRTIWHSLCDSFNERTGYRTLWKVYKGLAGKTKTSNTGSNLALRLDITEEELAEEAGDCFFPQQSKPPTAENAPGNIVRTVENCQRSSESIKYSSDTLEDEEATTITPNCNLRKGMLLILKGARSNPVIKAASLTEYDQVNFDESQSEQPIAMSFSRGFQPSLTKDLYEEDEGTNGMLMERPDEEPMEIREYLPREEHYDLITVPPSAEVYGQEHIIVSTLSRTPPLHRNRVLLENTKTANGPSLSMDRSDEERRLVRAPSSVTLLLKSTVELKHDVVEVGVAGVPPSSQLHPHEGARLPAQSSRPPINEDMDPSQSTATALEHSLSLDDSEEEQRLQTTPYAASTFQPWLPLRSRRKHPQPELGRHDDINIRVPSCLLPELLYPTARIATSDGMKLGLLWGDLLALRDHV